VSDPRQDFEVNVGGTFNILEAARMSENKPFLLFTSTNKVYGDLSSKTAQAQATRYASPEASKGTTEDQPLDFHSPYGCSKGAADQYVRDYSRIYGLPTVVFRMSCIAGPRQFGNEDQGWVAHFLYSALMRIPVTIYGSGLQVRDVLNVSDLMRAFEMAQANKDKTRGEIYNVGGGPKNTVSLVEVIEQIKELTGHSLQFERDQLRPGDQLIYVTDHSKLTRDTGWQPEVSVRGTLENIYSWFRRNRDLFPTGRVMEMPSAAALTTAELGRSA
jgi:CDP-paratose 2-epimerase